MIRRVFVVGLAAFAMSLLTAGVASAAGSWGVSCYVQTGATAGTTATLRCNVTANPSYPSDHYYVVWYYPPGDGSCSSIDNHFCGWVPVTPGTVFTVTGLSATNVNILVYNETGTYSTFASYIGGCSHCTRNDFSGSNAGTPRIDTTVTSPTIIGVADSAPLVADQGGGGSSGAGLTGWSIFIGQGFGLAVVIWVFVWGMTMPIRYLMRAIS